MCIRDRLKESPDEIDTRLCGLITKVDVRTTKEGKKPWARIVLEDLSGSMEVLVFPDTYSALPRPLNVGEVVVISGSLSKRDDQPAFRAAQVLWLPEAYEQLLRELVLHCLLYTSAMSSPRARCGFSRRPAAVKPFPWAS